MHYGGVQIEERGIYGALPAPWASRSFPVYFQNGEVVDPQFKIAAGSSLGSVSLLNPETSKSHQAFLKWSTCGTSALCVNQAYKLMRHRLGLYRVVFASLMYDRSTCTGDQDEIIDLLIVVSTTFQDS